MVFGKVTLLTQAITCNTAVIVRFPVAYSGHALLYKVELIVTPVSV